MLTITTILIEIAKALGRWVLDFIKENGSCALWGYMIGKISDFRRRRSTARASWRKKWLDGRIRRWRRAASLVHPWQFYDQKGSDQVASDTHNCLMEKRILRLPMISRAEKEPSFHERIFGRPAVTKGKAA